MEDTTLEPEEYGEEAVQQFGFSPEVLKKLKERIAESVEAVDIGDLIMGTATQKVSIIAGKLEVTYRLMTPKHHSLISEKLPAADVAGDVDVRKLCMYTMACSVSMLNQTALGDPANGETNKDVQAIFLANTKALENVPELVFWLTWYNHMWFIERSNAYVTEEALGNG